MQYRVGLAALASTCAAIALLPAPAAAQGTVDINYDNARFDRRLTIVRATGPITLDGALEEVDWERAPVARGFIQNDPREGEPATYDTEVRVLYDDEAIYFGVFAAEPAPSDVIVSDLKKDFDTDSGDGFGVIIDTFLDGRNGYQFVINPAGAKWDAQIANEGREINVNWDAIWDVRTRADDGGWSAELWIPFRTLKFTAGDPQTWGLNFERKIRRLNENSYWAPLPRIYELDRVSLAGSIENMRGLRPGRNIRVKPYALGSSNSVTGVDLDGDFDAGIDVKYGVTNSLTWDFTVNTDFSQVEADEQQVNLSRFSLFFPEKRDFFLENSGIFQFGGGTSGGRAGGGGRQNASEPMRLFFSRQIGLSEAGDVIPILGGTRLTGRIGGAYSIGVLSIQQREVEDDDGQVRSPLTNFSALRMRRDILANSDIGFVFLNKEEAGSGYNRVGGVDANFQFGFLRMDAYAAWTASPQEEVPGNGENFTARGAFNYTTRTWQVRGHYSAIGERFNDEMGFVPRRGVNNHLLLVGYAFRPAWLQRFGMRETRPHWQVETFARRDGGGLESRYQDWHLPFYFNDGAFVEIGINPNVEEVRAPFTINAARGVRVNPGRYEFKEYFFLWNSNSSAPFSFTSRFAVGPFYDGNRRGYAFGPTVRVSEHLNASVNLQVNDIALTNGEYVSTLVTSRINYNFNTRMFVNALLQYNTDSDQWSSNIRFNVIHRPLSDIFLVYNERHDDRTGRTDRAFIAKMTYMMAL